MLAAQTSQRLFDFFLLPCFSLQAFSSAVEVLSLANEVMGQEVYRWRVISDDGQPVMSSCRLAISADTSLQVERDSQKRINTTSTVIVCGGSAYPRQNRRLDAWLREYRARRACLIGIASGTIVFARAGLAEGRRCAVHWEILPSFCERFPGVLSVQTAFEKDRDLHSCSGGDAPFDMFVNLVECEHGASVANRICQKAIAFRMRCAGDRQRLPVRSRVKLNHDAVTRTIDLMEAQISDPIQVEELAASSGISRRQLERLFRRELGRSPNRYYLDLRLERAHLLLVSTNLAIVEVLVACGFASPSHFSKVYRDTYGCAPHETRVKARENQRAQPFCAALEIA